MSARSGDTFHTVAASEWGHVVTIVIKHSIAICPNIKQLQVRSQTPKSWSCWITSTSPRCQMKWLHENQNNHCVRSQWRFTVLLLCSTAVQAHKPPMTLPAMCMLASAAASLALIHSLFHPRYVLQVNAGGIPVAALFGVETVSSLRRLPRHCFMVAVHVIRLKGREVVLGKKQKLPRKNDLRLEMVASVS